MKKSSDFSINTQKLLDGATFAELDAAEKRLLLAGYQAGLLATMPPEARAAVTWLQQHGREEAAGETNETKLNEVTK